jgi:pantothenate kinase
MRFEDLVERASALLSRERALLGICGAPAAGKSTLAERLVAALGPSAVYVGMDGFHLAQVELERLGRTERKGAPDTFDAAGYVNLLRRLRSHPPDEVVYAPGFRRDLEEPIAGAVPVPPSVRLVVTEGNYLLMSDPPWDRVRGLLDEAWFLDPPEDDRRQWLIDRHRAFGRSLAEARERTFGSDERNAVLINATRLSADLVVPVIPVTRR